MSQPRSRGVLTCSPRAVVDQLARGRAVLALLLEVQRELARGTRPAELPAALRVPPARVRWALAVLGAEA